MADMYREFASMAFLQTLFIEEHEEVASGVHRTLYEDGTSVTVDFNAGEYRIQ